VYANTHINIQKPKLAKRICTSHIAPITVVNEKKCEVLYFSGELISAPIIM
jgi:hypothetical protein